MTLFNPNYFWDTWFRLYVYFIFMSNSYRKAFVRDKPRNAKRSSLYWRGIRRSVKNLVSTFKNRWIDPYRTIKLDELPGNFQDIEFLEDTIPDPRAIINDYDYEDYKLDYEYSRGLHNPFSSDGNYRARYRRK